MIAVRWMQKYESWGLQVGFTRPRNASAVVSLKAVSQNLYIEYLKDFFKYLKFLKNGLATKKKPARKLFDECHNIFSTYMASSRRARGSSDNRHDAIMSELNYTEEDESEEKEDQQAD
jgi:hypothetical protein